MTTEQFTDINPQQSGQTAQTHWYHATVSHRLQGAADRVVQCQQPQQIIEDIENILHLLDQARADATLKPATANLIMLLHPWPLKLGYWAKWKDLLRFAINVCEEQNLHESRAKLLNDLSGMMLQSGQVDEALKLATQALEVCRCHGVASLLVPSAGSIIDIQLYQYHISAAESLLSEIEAEALPDNVSASAQAEVAAQIGLLRAVLARRQNNNQIALHYIHEALTGLRPFTDKQSHLMAHLYRIKGLLYWDRGLYSTASRCFRGAAVLFKKDGDKFNYSWALGNLGLSCWSNGELFRAEKVTLYSFQIAKRLRASWQMTFQAGNMGLVYLSLGRLKEARRWIEKQMRMSRTIGIAAEEARAQGNLGVVKLHLGEYTSALEDLEADRQGTEQAGNLGSLSNIYANMARCLYALGSVEQGLVFAQQSVLLADQAKSVPARLVALRCLADCQPPAESRESLRLALTLAKDRPLDHAGCLLTLAHLTHDMELWEQGCALLDAIGATAWLRKGYGSQNQQHYSIDNPPCIVAIC